MRINWFSPLPPARTGIANYTAMLLPALRRWAEVTLWTEQDDWDAGLERLAQVRRLHPGHVPVDLVNAAEISFYHIGNNADFHSGIWQVSRQVPGVVVLHDVRLHEFFAGLYKERWGDRGGYLHEVGRIYGEAGRRDADRFWNGEIRISEMIERWPLTPLALDNALGGVVHVSGAVHQLEPGGPWPILQAHLPHKVSPRVRDGRGARRAVAPYRLVMYGHIGPNRRLEPVLKALATLPERDLFHLDVCGEIWNAEAIGPLLSSLGIAGRVSLHGFVPDERLAEFLTHAHLAINLRFPTMGEASLSQLGIWEHALPSLVTRIGWYADLPEDAVAFVRPDHEIGDIQSHLRSFLADPDRFALMGERGRRFLEVNHSPEAYVEALRSFLEPCRRSRVDRTVCYLADRAGEDLGNWAGQTVTDEVSRTMARRIHEMLSV